MDHSKYSTIILYYYKVNKSSVLTYLKKNTKLIQLTDGIVRLVVLENSPFQGCLRVKAKVNFVTKETRDLARLV